MKKFFVIISVLILLFAFAYTFEKREAKILFVGDMMFDRYLRQVSYAKGGDYPLSCIKDFLKSFDLVVGNLEGPITENASKSMFTKTEEDNNFIFTFPTATAEMLSRNNIKLVNLGNNHILNFGNAGLESTKKFLKEEEVNYLDFNKKDISFVSYNEFGGESVQKISEKIKKEKESGRTVIVYAHWGDEYVPPPARVKRLARSFVDAGADLIVGSHPHIIQESEIYKGKYIYYSLGNFVFDQYWDEQVSTGLALEVRIKNGNMEIAEHRVQMQKDGRTCLKN